MAHGSSSYFTQKIESMKDELLKSDVLTEETKREIINFCDDKSVHSIYQLNFAEFFIYVWNRITNFDMPRVKFNNDDIVVINDDIIQQLAFQVKNMMENENNDTKKSVEIRKDRKELREKIQMKFNEEFGEKKINDNLIEIAINKHVEDSKKEMYKRLNEEIKDAESKCFTGRMTRMVPILIGYYSDVYQNISSSEQIGNVLSSLVERYNGDKEIIAKEFEKELRERDYNDETINQWKPYIEEYL